MRIFRQPLNMFTRFKRDDEGATAIEFAAVSMPFFILVFALIGYAMYFFVMNALEKGMDQSSRLVRTGQAQKLNMKVDEFKDAICDGAGDWIKCPKVQVFVQKYPTWDVIEPQKCLNADGSVVTNGATGTDPIATYTGTASEIVVVTTCYKWEFSKQVPFIKLGNMNDNSMMMQSSTAFRTEPYAN